MSSLKTLLSHVYSLKDLSDYRLISLLYYLSKAFERLVHIKIVRYFNSCYILSLLQSRFRSARSTTTAQLKVTDDIRKAMDNPKITLLTLFDL